MLTVKNPSPEEQLPLGNLEYASGLKLAGRISGCWHVFGELHEKLFELQHPRKLFPEEHANLSDDGCQYCEKREK